MRFGRPTNVVAVASTARKQRLRGTTAANRIPNRFGDKGKEAIIRQSQLEFMPTAATIA
jgi:hypothetical protein